MPKTTFEKFLFASYQFIQRIRGFMFMHYTNLQWYTLATTFDVYRHVRKARRYCDKYRSWERCTTAATSNRGRWT